MFSNRVAIALLLIAALVAVASPASAQYMYLDSNGNGVSDPQILLPAAVLSGINNWVAASPVTFYAEAGDVPTLSVQGQFTQPVSNTGQAAIVGHLVDAP